jgi:hypothetical protein
VYLWPKNKPTRIADSERIPAGAFKWRIDKIDEDKYTIRNVEFDEPLFVSSLFWVIIIII